MKLFSQDTKENAFRRATLFKGSSRKQLIQLARRSEALEVGQEIIVIIDGEVEVTKNGKTKGPAGRRTPTIQVSGDPTSA